MPGSTVLMKPNSSGKTLFARCDLEGCWSSFRDDLKASSQRRQTENRSFAKAGRSTLEIPCLQEMASVFKENCHDQAFRILWINACPLM
jgi:hypothetical protein